MLSADWIIRAQRTRSQRLHQMVLEMPRLLHKAAKGPLRIRASRIKEYAEPLGHHVRVDALTYGTGRIAAAHRKRLNEKVRESVQQHVRATRECALAFSILHPLLMSHRKGTETLLDGWSCQPSHYRCRAEPD